MPMSASNGSMFPPYDYDYEEFASSCDETYGVCPMIHARRGDFGLLLFSDDFGDSDPRPSQVTTHTLALSSHFSL